MTAPLRGRVTRGCKKKGVERCSTPDKAGLLIRSERKKTLKARNPAPESPAKARQPPMAPLTIRPPVGACKGLSQPCPAAAAQRDRHGTRRPQQAARPPPCLSRSLCPPAPGNHGSRLAGPSGLAACGKDRPNLDAYQMNPPKAPQHGPPVHVFCSPSVPPNFRQAIKKAYRIR